MIYSLFQLTRHHILETGNRAWLIQDLINNTHDQGRQICFTWNAINFQAKNLIGWMVKGHCVWLAGISILNFLLVGKDVGCVVDEWPWGIYRAYWLWECRVLLFLLPWICSFCVDLEVSIKIKYLCETRNHLKAEHNMKHEKNWIKWLD